jgi:phytoene desaturase
MGSEMMMKSVIVIGAGVGGIAAATHLAKRGVHVTVLEKNAKPGGRCGQFTRDGHRFDSGPTLLVMRQLYESEFEALGASLSERLDLQRVDPTYHLVFDDGTRLRLTSDLLQMQSQLESIEPGSFDGYFRYVEEGHRHYRLAMDRLLNRDFRSVLDLFNVRNLPLLFQAKPLLSHYQHMSAYFHDPRLKAAFTFQDGYMGLSPYEAPATFSLMPYTELAHGVWYPRGGMYRVVEALVDIAAEAGVDIIPNTAVERIEVNGTAARGVVLADGQRLEADAVLANADLPYVYQDLLPPDGQAKRLVHKRYSYSAVSFFWGVDRRYEALGPHTLFLADDYKANFESLVRGHTLPQNPMMYIHAPARLDPDMAPPGEDTLIAIVPVGHLTAEGEQDWGAIRDRARGEVFRRLATLGMGDLEAHIKFEESFTPLSWRKRYNLVKGATHGLYHNLTQLAYFRPDNQHARYRNLYFVGASTRPGTGIPTALVSARLAVSRMLGQAVT